MARVLITGACGFIGSCLARRLLERGDEVHGIDNLSRRGAELNLRELRHPAFTLHRIDLADGARVTEVFQKIGPVDALFHFAAQVAVTTSYLERTRDFRDNAAASFNVIDAAQRFTPDAYCLYASTNKVYGHITLQQPVGLAHPLDPYTPYGVSKAVGELYFTEFGRPEIGLRTCSLRQSCIYGHHQFGVEDQGWMAWFAIANLLGRAITLYGDGRQIRDLLFIDDLIDLYLECWERDLRGVYPVGGGPDNAIALTEGLGLIEEIAGRAFAKIDHGPARPGDQPYFVADLSWLREKGLAWSPQTAVRAGVGKMIGWINDNSSDIRTLLAG